MTERVPWFDRTGAADSKVRRRRGSNPPPTFEKPTAPPGPPQQREIAGMATNDAAAFLHDAQQRKQQKQSKNKAGEENFDFDCRRFRLPPHVRQFRLMKSEQTPRKDGKAIPKVWVFDFAWADLKLIVEIDGGIFMPGGGAHSHPVDVKRNLSKRNDAALAGFTVLGFMPEQVKRGEAIEFVLRVLATKGWTR